MILEDICKSFDKPVYINAVARMPKAFWIWILESAKRA